MLTFTKKIHFFLIRAWISDKDSTTVKSVSQRVTLITGLEVKQTPIEGPYSSEYLQVSEKMFSEASAFYCIFYFLRIYLPNMIIVTLFNDNN